MAKKAVYQITSGNIFPSNQEMAVLDRRHFLQELVSMAAMPLPSLRNWSSWAEYETGGFGVQNQVSVNPKYLKTQDHRQWTWYDRGRD